MSGGFTPAPWAMNPFNAQVDAFDSGEPVPVCQLLWPTDLRTEATTEANAHLIAAAPALYAKLERAAFIFRTYAELHRAKKTEEGDAKAASNDLIAEEMEAALKQARGDLVDPYALGGGK